MRYALNLNSNVYFKPNAAGLKRMKARRPHNKPDEAGFYELQMHQFIETFCSPEFWISSAPVERCSVYVEGKDLEACDGTKSNPGAKLSAKEAIEILKGRAMRINVAFGRLQVEDGFTKGYVAGLTDALGCVDDPDAQIAPAWVKEHREREKQLQETCGAHARPEAEKAEDFKEQNLDASPKELPSEKDLCPYCGGSYESSDGKPVAGALCKDCYDENAPKVSPRPYRTFSFEFLQKTYGGMVPAWLAVAWSMKARPLLHGTMDKRMTGAEVWEAFRAAFGIEG